MRATWNLDSRCTVLLPGAWIQGFVQVLLKVLKNRGDVMKQIINTYSFNKTAKTVTLTDFTTISLGRILLITNVTAHTVVYQFNNPALGGSVSGNVLTLTYNTSAMSNTDKLQIIYDTAAGDPMYDAPSVFAQGLVASGAVDTGNPVKVGGKYNATPPFLADGQRGDLQLDSASRSIVTLGTLIAGEDIINNTLGTTDKPAIGAGYSFNLTRGFTSGTYQTAKTAPGNLGCIVVSNTNAAVRYLLIINSASAPSGSTGLIVSLPIPAGTATSPGYVMLGKDVLNNLFLNAGIQIAVSTAEGTYTAATASDHTLHTESI
jgi:hypothetical protein